MTNTQQPVRVRWSNGHVDSAPSWQDLLDKVRMSQWHAWTEDEFRQVLGKRAIRWNGTFIDTTAEPEALFREMERAHLVEILDPTDDDREEL